LIRLVHEENFRKSGKRGAQAAISKKNDAGAEDRKAAEGF
jgi:hypothetical protein